MGQKTKSVRASGELVIYEQEGGYGAPVICVGNTQLHDLFDELVPNCSEANGKIGVRVEISVRIIPSNDQEEATSDE